ncbi:MAG TPA: methyltransferase domain-containing protein [Pyrinomonadaceae bacterium]|nr:methyltransferase domain-containing protein [Pyrinomonadaceae bacterium]
MSAPLKKVAGQSKTLIILHRIVDNWRRRKAFESGQTTTAYGSTHESWSLEKSVAYINLVYREYLEYSGLTPEAVRGWRVLEVGPGDNFGVALKFLADGAAKVVSLDKFYSERNAEQQARIYQELRKQLGPEQAAVFDESIKFDKELELNKSKIEYIYGHGIEEADQILEPESFHFIVSRAVLHNVYDIDRGFDAMDRLLAPGGYMAHKIDFSDENMFSSRGMHPLTFLTIPEGIYRLMAKDSGKPNRRLINDYRELMRKRGYEAKLFVSSVVGVGALARNKEKIERGVDYGNKTVSLIDEIRPKLAPPYRKLAEEELAAAGIFLVARKPQRGTKETNPAGKG